MELINLTAEKIVGMFDGIETHFPIGETVEVPDDAGNHFLEKLSACGLQKIRARSDMNLVRLEALRSRLRFHETQVEYHERANYAQKEKNFPALPKTDGVKHAEAMIPIYREHIERLESKLAASEIEAVQAQARAALDKPVPESPSIEDSPTDAIRRYASDIGIDWKPEWSRKTLLQKIREKAQKE